ncbi:MAG: hypothetical protein D3905_09085, partial [Candidatus Electrothrix sp. AS4_5]|nr:hypothetical protein [Candidatus Electrothrix gigas]
MRRANPIYDVVFKYLMKRPGVRCNLKNYPIQSHTESYTKSLGLKSIVFTSDLDNKSRKYRK